MGTSAQFLCKCKKQKGWIEEGKNTKPCPNCTRIYKGRYNPKELTIDAQEQNPSYWSPNRNQTCIRRLCRFLCHPLRQKLFKDYNLCRICHLPVKSK